MDFEFYDYVSGDVIGRVPLIDFGSMIQNQHCIKPVVLRALASEQENTNYVYDLIIFLQNKGQLDSTFGYYRTPGQYDFIPSIESGDSRFVVLAEVPSATQYSAGGISLTIDQSTRYSEYLWLDVQMTQTGYTEANFRAFFSTIT
jgi:hypothetical protein